MTQAYNITGNVSGPSGLLGSVFRKILAVLVLMGMVALGVAFAALAFFIILGVMGLIAFIIAVLWGKAKITGKPFGPRAYMKSRGFDLDNPFDESFRAQTASDGSAHGPIIDAEETSDGWSVEK